MNNNILVPWIEDSITNPINCNKDSSQDWGMIGFQGSNPATDFRGMGMLGLLQLHYYSNWNGGTSAKNALTTANHSVRYFPFAATGINITKFCIELLRECRLHHFLFITHIMTTNIPNCL